MDCILLSQKIISYMMPSCDLANLVIEKGTRYILCCVCQFVLSIPFSLYIL